MRRMLKPFVVTLFAVITTSVGYSLIPSSSADFQDSRQGTISVTVKIPAVQPTGSEPPLPPKAKATPSSTEVAATEPTPTTEPEPSPTAAPPKSNPTAVASTDPVKDEPEDPKPSKTTPPADKPTEKTKEPEPSIEASTPTPTPKETNSDAEAS